MIGIVNTKIVPSPYKGYNAQVQRLMAMLVAKDEAIIVFLSFSPSIYAILHVQYGIEQGAPKEENAKLKTELEIKKIVNSKNLKFPCNLLKKNPPSSIKLHLLLLPVLFILQKLTAFSST